MPHPDRGVAIEQTVAGDCAGERFVFAWRPGEPGLQLDWGRASARWGGEAPLVRDVIAPRVRPASFWARCDADHVLTLGFTVALPGETEPRLASGTAEFNPQAELVGYSGLRSERPESVNRYLD